MSVIGEKAPYPRGVLAERGQVFAELYSHPREEVFGFVVDSPATRSHEQGIWLSENGDMAFLSVPDLTNFPPGGVLDNHGLSRVESRYGTEGDVSRLFKDPILYAKLDLGSPEPTPAISFVFLKNDQGEWEFEEIEQTYFHCKGKIERAPVEDSNQPPLQRLETELITTLSAWMQDQEAQHHIGFIPDPHDRLAAHRPLRQWSDFKNLQIIVDLYKRNTPQSLLTAEARASITAYVQNASIFAPLIQGREATSQATPQEQDTFFTLLRILRAHDISKFALSQADFITLSDDILEKRVDLTRLVGVGSILGVISVGSTDEGVHFYRACGKTVPTTDPENFIISILQAAHRKDSPRSFYKLRRQAAEQQLLREIPLAKENIRTLHRLADRRRNQAFLGR